MPGLAADLHHFSSRASTEFMAFRFLSKRLREELFKIFVRSVAQRISQIDLLIREQAESQLPIGGQAQSIA